MIEAYKVNCVAPILLTKYLRPLLKTSSKNYKHQAMSINKACVLQISTDWASFVERETSSDGSMYPYRCSKTALNMGMKNLSIDLKDDGVLVLAVHPGWVRTDMGGQDGPMSTEESVKAMLKTVRNMTDIDHGAFVQFDGVTLFW